MVNQTIKQYSFDMKVIENKNGKFTRIDVSVITHHAR